MKNVLLLSLFLVHPAFGTEGVRVKVELLRTANDGIQPQAAIDADGTLHLIYFKGAAKGGNVFYVKRDADLSTWSDPIRVNSEKGSARRNGAISHAQLALGKDDRIHVTWFNMRPPKYFYSASRDDGQGFEPQRNLVTEHAEGVEAGASIAADGRGNVYLVWHAGRFDKEDERRIYIRYREDGKTFGAETRIDNGGGVCACCGLSAATDPDGALIVSYRAATDFVDRDITLLKSDDGGENVSSTTVHKWNIPACPVSTTSVALGPENRMLMSWETEGQVFFTRVGGKDAGKDFKIIPAPGDTNDRRKNPTVAMNRLGEVLLAWGDGPGWRSGGVLHWQVYDAEGMATDTSGVGDEMPEFSVPTAVATGEGFVVVY